MTPYHRARCEPARVSTVRKKCDGQNSTCSVVEIKLASPGFFSQAASSRRSATVLSLIGRPHSGHCEFGGSPSRVYPQPSQRTDRSSGTAAAELAMAYGILRGVSFPV